MGIAAFVLAGGYFFFGAGRQSAPSAPQPSATEPSADQEPSLQLPVEQTAATEGNAVIYTDAGYSPEILKVGKGSAVTFKNQSSRSMWTASGGHPSHRAYPTTGGCISSTFDACEGIQPGESWSFGFDIPGTWDYHNHVRPGDTGIVIVQ